VINYTIQPEKQNALSDEIWNSLLKRFEQYTIVTSDVLVQHLPLALKQRILWYVTEPFLHNWQSLPVDVHHPQSVQAFIEIQQVIHQQVYIPFSHFSRWLQKAVQEWLAITAQPIPYMTKTYFTSETTLLPLSVLQITKTYWGELSVLIDLLIKYLEKNYQKDIDALLFEAKLYKTTTLLQQKEILPNMVAWWENYFHLNPIQYGAWLLETQPIRMQLPEARLRQYIPVNDQFEYITHLFNGDREEYTETLKFAEKHSYETAEKYIREVFQKNYVSPHDVYATRFLAIIRSFIEQENLL
jgi:hypothetical protein